MDRRTFLASGFGSLGAVALGGCVLEREDDTPDEPPSGLSDREPGYAPNPRDVAAPDADPASFERIDVDGTPVPLAPIDVAHPWYLRRDARFVDARSLAAYEASHIAGAVHSPAPDGYRRSDPVSAWPPSERIVTYCGCPHHLSSMRAASLIENGYEQVYALDEGFYAWQDRGYPIASSNAAPTFGEKRRVEGSVPAKHAGAFAWLRHEPTGQREPGEIRPDGSFAITFHFVEIGPESVLKLETPAWTVRDTVAELTGGRL